MTPTLDQAREMAQGPLTPEQLRAISDAALLAVGFVQDYPRPHEPTCPLMWKAPNPAPGVLPDRWFPIHASRITPPPHPAADLTDAVRWMVPEGCAWQVTQRLDNLGPTAMVQRRNKSDPRLFDIWIDLDFSPPATPALALTLAGWAAAEQKEREG